MKEKIIYGVRVRLKSESNMMKFLGWISKPFNPGFMSNVYTTVGTIVYAPSKFNIDKEEDFHWHRDILEHEKIHVDDFKKWHILFWISYWIPPIWNYMRFYWERKAYLPELQRLSNEMKDDAVRAKIARIAYLLSHSEYFWAWKESWVKNWFFKKLDIKP